MKRSGLILSLILIAVAVSLLFRHAQHEARSADCRNHLRLIAFCIRDHVSAYGQFPPASSRNDAGELLHSWRLDAMKMNEYFDFDQHLKSSEPWTSAQNKELFAAFNDSIFHCPSVAAASGVTQYVAIVGPQTVWDPTISLDNLRNETLLVIEWPKSDVYWAEPRDLTLDDVHRLISSGEFATAHSSSLRYVDWAANVHEIPLDSSTFKTIQQLARVPATSNAEQPLAK